MDDPLSRPTFSESEVATRWGMTESSLRNKRARCPDQVPPFFKIGKLGVRYPVDAVFAFEQNLIEQNQRP